MKEFSEVFSEIVAGISPVIEVTVQAGSDYYCCHSKWARKGKFLKGTDINGNIVSKRIIAVVDGVKIRLEDSLIVGSTLILNPPFDITGTKMATNLEWTKSTNFALEKTPLIWLLDSFEDDEFGDESVIERSVSCKIFFLDETDIKNYLTKDHKEQVVQPMMNLKDEFLEVIKKNRKFKTITDKKTRYFSRFGTESPQGYEKNILDANLSGLVLTITLTKYKENCKC